MRIARTALYRNWASSPICAEIVVAYQAFYFDCKIRNGPKMLKYITRHYRVNPTNCGERHCIIPADHQEERGGPQRLRLDVSATAHLADRKLPSTYHVRIPWPVLLKKIHLKLLKRKVKDMCEEKGGVLRQVQHLPGVLLQGRQDASHQKTDDFGEKNWSTSVKINSVNLYKLFKHSNDANL